MFPNWCTSETSGVAQQKYRNSDLEVWGDIWDMWQTDVIKRSCREAGREEGCCFIGIPMAGLSEDVQVICTETWMLWRCRLYEEAPGKSVPRGGSSRSTRVVYLWRRKGKQCNWKMGRVSKSHSPGRAILRSLCVIAISLCHDLIYLLKRSLWALYGTWHGDKLVEGHLGVVLRADGGNYV